MAISTSEERGAADDEGHHAADEAHRGQEELATDERRDRDHGEERSHHDRDRRQPDPLEGRPSLTFDRSANCRLIHVIATV